MFEPNASSVFSNQDWSPAGSIHAHDYKNDYSNNLNKHYQPLGRSYSHDHYIKPIPPMYVTEYEAAYTWPPSTAYSPQAQYNYYKEKKGIDRRGKKQWSTLKDVINKLLDKGYEPNLLKVVLQQVETRRFDTVIEYAYNHFLDVVKQVRQLTPSPSSSAAVGSMSSSSSSSSSSSGSDSSSTTTHIPAEVMELCKQFVEAIEAIKDA